MSFLETTVLVISFEILIMILTLYVVLSQFFIIGPK